MDLKQYLLGSSAHSTATKHEGKDSSDQKIDVNRLLDGIALEKKKPDSKKAVLKQKVLSPEEQLKKD